MSLGQTAPTVAGPGLGFGSALGDIFSGGLFGQGGLLSGLFGFGREDAGVAGPGAISQGGVVGTTGVGQANDAATSATAAAAAGVGPGTGVGRGPGPGAGVGTHPAKVRVGPMNSFVRIFNG